MDRSYPIEVKHCVAISRGYTGAAAEAAGREGAMLRCRFAKAT
jgi:hypothetical protein